MADMQNYSEQELMQKLRAAHDAGRKDHAARIAEMVRQKRRGSTEAPQETQVQQHPATPQRNQQPDVREMLDFSPERLASDAKGALSTIAGGIDTGIRDADQAITGYMQEHGLATPIAAIGDVATGVARAGANFATRAGQAGAQIPSGLLSLAEEGATKAAYEKARYDQMREQYGADGILERDGKQYFYRRKGGYSGGLVSDPREIIGPVPDDFDETFGAGPRDTAAMLRADRKRRMESGEELNLVERLQYTAQEGGDSFAQSIEPEPGSFRDRGNFFTKDVMGAAGSFAVFGLLRSLAGNAGRLASYNRRTGDAAGQAATFSTMAGMGQQDLQQDAMESGADPETQALAGTFGVMLGAAQGLPLEFAVRRAATALSGGKAKQVLQRTKDAIVTGLSEGALESAYEVGKDASAIGLGYDKDRDPWENVVNTYATAGLGGLVSSLIMAAVTKKRGPGTPGTNRGPAMPDDAIVQFGEKRANVLRESLGKLKGDERQQAEQELADLEAVLGDPEAIANMHNIRREGDPTVSDVVDAFAEEDGSFDAATVDPDLADPQDSQAEPADDTAISQATLAESNAGLEQAGQQAGAFESGVQQQQTALQSEQGQDVSTQVDGQPVQPGVLSGDQGVQVPDQPQQPPSFVQQSPQQAPVSSEQPPQPSEQASELTERGTGVYRVPVDQINVDPEAYQFRSNVNEQGVDNRLADVEKWDDARSGNVLLHRRADGSLYVADGHHRVDLAKRLGQGAINARIVDEADGVDVADARVEAAMNNIADGKAEPVDVAKVLRDSKIPAGEARKRFNLPANQVTRDGENLAKLGDNAFGLVTSGQLSDKDGAAIGAMFDDPAQQDAAAAVFQRVQPDNEFKRQQLAKQIRDAEFAKQGGNQDDLFGTDDNSVSLLQERLSVLHDLSKEFRTQGKLFKTLNKNADRASEAGNRIAREANAEISEKAAQALSLIDRVTTTPDLNAMVNAAAQRVANGEKRSTVVADLKKELQGYEPGKAAADSERSDNAQSSRQDAESGQDTRGSERASSERAAGRAGRGKQGSDGRDNALTLEQQAEPEQGAPEVDGAADATGDLFGGRDETAQAVLDANTERERKQDPNIGANIGDGGLFDPQQGLDLAQQEEDRRQDTETRKRVEDMTLEEARKALLVDDLTGLGNRRAYQERERRPVQVSFDADSLKFINDTMGHPAGDKMLSLIGRAFLKQPGYGERFDADHPSGDEFYGEFESVEEAKAISEAVDRELRDAVIQVKTPDGEVLTKRGIGLSYGIASTLEQAEIELQKHKAAREASGERAGRGEEPPGFTRAGVDRGVFEDASEGINDNQREAGKRAVESEQPRATDQAEKKPRRKPDGEGVRFSRKQDTGERNLYVAHNISERGLKHAMELGGLAAPSLAVARTDKGGFEEFGEITLLADPSMLESRKARTFDADVYSPRFPRAEYKIDHSGFRSQIDSLGNRYNLSEPSVDQLENDGPQALLHSPAYQFAFLKEIGKSVVPKKEKVEPIVRKLAEMGVNRFSVLNDPKAMEEITKHARQTQKAIDAAMKDDPPRRNPQFYSLFAEDGKVKDSVARDLAAKAKNYRDSEGIDTGQMRHAIAKKMRPKKTQERFEQWVTEKFNEITTGRELFDGFTYSGKRRTKPYTLENIVKMMTKELQGGENFNYGAGSVRAKYAREMKKVAQVQAQRDRIVPAEEMDAIKEESNKRLRDVLEQLKPFYKFDADGWGYTDDASSAIAEGPSGWRETFELNDESRAIITDFVDYLKGLPTAYFETKVGRAVDLSEFSIAVVPKGTPQATVKALRDQGITVKRYDASVEGDRARVIAEQEKVLFSRQKEREKTQTEQPAQAKRRVQKKVDALTTEWQNAPRIVTVSKDTDTALPDAIRQAIEQNNAYGQIDGVFYDDTVYLIADQLPTDADVERVVLHEAIGHYGLRQALGTDIEATLEQVYLSYGRKGAQHIITNYFDAAGRRFDPNNKNHRLEVADELVAHMAQTGQKPSLWKKVVAAIRDALRKLGFTLRLNDADVMNLIRRARNAVQNGGISMSQPQGQPAAASRRSSESEARFSRAPNKPLHEQNVDERQRTLLDNFWKQPIDRTFRAVFDFSGSLDTQGRVKFTAAQYDKLSNALVNARPFAGSRFPWADTFIEQVRAGMISHYKLPEGVRDLERMKDAEVSRRSQEAQEILQTLADANVGPDEARVLNDILTGEQVDDAAMNRLAAPIRQAIIEMGEDAVSLGLISVEAFERNKGAYLHRSYEKREGDQTTVASWVSRAARAHRRNILGNATKGRGMTMRVKNADLRRADPDWWKKKTEDGKADTSVLGKKFHVFVKYADAEPDATQTAPGMEDGGPRRRRVVQRDYWLADKPVPAKYKDWTDKGKWEARTSKGGDIVLWRDFTKAERRSMGEILDARYNIAKTYHEMNNDLANGRMFAEIAKNPEWFQTKEPEGRVISAAEGRQMFDGWNTFASVDWVKVPAGGIKNSKAKRWGALAGGYVRAEIWRNLNELDKMQYRGAWNAIMTQWKLNKTALNPVVHMNNVMSNLILMDLADVSAFDLVAGIREMVEKGQEYRNAQEHGAFGGMFVNEELQREVLEPILQEIKDSDLQQDGITSRIRVLNKLFSGYARASRAMKEFYQTEDEVFRMATYLSRRAKGESVLDAAKLAREQFLDYDIRAPWVNQMRRTVLPFISYTYRAIPVLAQAIAYRPWKLAKYFTLTYLANHFAYMLSGGDEDEERRTMREQLQGNTLMMTPRMIRMPGYDENGNPLFLDIRRWIPGGDIFDTQQSNSAIPVPAPLQPGGPLVLAGEIFFNRSAFTDDDITLDSMTTGEKFSAAGKHLYQGYMPSSPWVPGSHYWEKIGDAFKGAMDPLGREYNPVTATLSAVGVKLSGHDVDLQRRYLEYDLRRERDEIRYLITTVEREHARGKMSREERDKKMENYRAKLENIAERYRRLHGRD